MSEILPDEFPFNRKQVATPVAAEKPAPIPPADYVVASSIPIEPVIEIERAGVLIYKGKERRRSPRQSMRGKAIFTADASPAAAGPVQILNISMLGVRFFSPRALSPADRGTIRMELGPLKWSSKLRIIHCEPQPDGGHLIGCETIGNELSRRKNITAAA